MQLFANPDFLQLYDDRIRDWNPLSSTYSGTIDSCGWPGEEGDPGSSKQFPRKTDCFYEDFRYGWNSSRVKIALTKSKNIVETLASPLIDGRAVGQPVAQRMGTLSQMPRPTPQIAIPPSIRRMSVWKKMTSSTHLTVAMYSERTC